MIGCNEELDWRYGSEFATIGYENVRCFTMTLVNLDMLYVSYAHMPYCSLLYLFTCFKFMFPHVHIPPHSRFSKCYHCWEYKSAMEGTTNLAAKEQIKALFMQHIFLQMAERRDYWAFKGCA